MIDGHYGSSGSYNAATHAKDSGSGRLGDTGAYQKAQSGANQGAVFAVAGSSGKTSGTGALNHPAMYISMKRLGSMVIDVDGNELTARFLEPGGVISDWFTINKGGDITPPSIVSVQAEGETVLEVAFSESVDQASAENKNNYSLSGDISVNAAAMLCDSNLVRLTTSAMAANDNYTLSVTGVQDLAGNLAFSEQNAFTFNTTLQKTFRHAAAPDSCYVGASDTSLSENEPNDSSYGAASTLLVDGSDPSPFDKLMLLQWELSTAGIPAGSVVLSASVVLEVLNPTGDSYSLFELLAAWSESQATWNQAANGVPWEAAGANGPSDRGALVGQIASAANGELTIPLNAAGIAAVQSWLDTPASVSGLIMATTSSSDGLDVQSKEGGAPDLRPALKITYQVPTGPAPDPGRARTLGYKWLEQPPTRQLSVGRRRTTMSLSPVICSTGMPWKSTSA